MADDNPEENVHGGNDDVPPPEPKAMSIRFADTNNNELVFKLRSTTKLKKAMDTYAQHKGLQRHTLRFIFEGDRILDDHTPEFVCIAFRHDGTSENVQF